MSFLTGGAKKQAQQQPSYTGLDIQTSAQGKAIPIVVGAMRVAPNLLWYGDFESHKQESSAGSGGKGGNSGASSSVSYTYSASVIMGLCEGPIYESDAVWVGKGTYLTSSLGFSIFTGTYPQVPWGYLETNYGPITENHTIPSSAPYQVTVSEASSFTGNSGVVATTPRQMTKVVAAPAPAQYETSGAGTYTFNSANAGNEVTISCRVQASGTSIISAVYSNTIPNTAPYQITIALYQGDLGVTLGSRTFSGVSGTVGAGQYTVVAGVYTFNAADAGTPIQISYTALSVDTQALPYSGIAYAAVANYSLGDSADLSNHNFQVKGFYYGSVSGSDDADPSLFVYDALCNPHWGVGFPSQYIGDLTTYQEYALATGLLVSFCLDSQTTAASVLGDLMTATNSEFVWSEGLLRIVPYGDLTVTGNGKTYTPPSSPLVNLTDDDFYIETTGDDPVQLTRSRPSDAYNSLQVEYLDRTNAYNTAIAEADDQASIDLYGLRQQSGSGTHLFALGGIAQISAQLQLQRQAIRNTYQFTTDERYIWLDPMDIITITDEWLGLNQQWVRITEIELNDDGTLTFTAEENLDGTGHAATYSLQSGGGFTANYNTDPGDTNAPIIFEPPVQIATTSGLEVWMLASGGSSYGGCDVWISADGDNYQSAGRITGQCRQGFLSADLPIGTASDTTNIAYVNLSESNGALLSGTQNDALVGNTLCYVGGELLAYETATLTGPNAYGLTYLNRGMYGTTVADHPPNTQFGRLDQNKFVYNYDKDQIGQTIYVKMLAFNTYMGGLQSLDEVNAYTHLIQGPPLPPSVQGFNVQQSGGAVVFRWDEVTDYALKGYDILYGPQGGGLTTAKFLTESARGTEMTNASVPPGNWTFYIQGHDIADQVSAVSSTCNLSVTNQNQLVAAPAQAPNWLGTLSGFVQHWTGVLVPVGTNVASEYTVLAPPAAPSLASVSGGALAARSYTVVITYTTASGETLVSSPATISLAANTLLSIASPAASGAAEAWNIYASASGAETLQNAAPVLLGAGWTEPTTGLVSGAAMPSANSTGWEVFNVAVPDPVASATYTAPTIDTGFNSTFRVFAATAYNMLPGNNGIPSIKFELDYWLSGGTDAGSFAEFETGLITAENVRGRLSAEIEPGSVPFISLFTPTIDIPPATTTLTSVAISAAGTAITYPQQYHQLPNVQVTGTSSGVTGGAAVSETATGCTVFLYNGSTAVSGTANITITGV